MGLNIGNLFAQLSLDNKQFNQQLGISEGLVRRFNTTIGTASTQAKATFAVIAASSTLLGKNLLKLASDMEETQSKFNTAFRGIEAYADKMATTLAKSYNLSQLEAKKLLASTGDLLKGFGFTAEEALQLAYKVQTLAADLASYNNVQGGTKQASEILTKALLGEREALTTLGIKILDADVQHRLLEKGQANLTGQALLAAKAQATYELAIQQSKDAIGDLARTHDSFANQLRRNKALITDISSELGEKLLPIANNVLTSLNNELASIDIDKVFSSDTFARISKITLGVAGLVGAFATVGTVVSTLSNPLVQLVTVSALVVGAIRNNFLHLGDVFDFLKNKTINLVKTMLSAADLIEARKYEKLAADLTRLQQVASNIDFSKIASKSVFGALSKEGEKTVKELEIAAKKIESLGLSAGGIRLAIYELSTMQAITKDTTKKMQEDFKRAFERINRDSSDLVDKLEQRLNNTLKLSDFTGITGADLLPNIANTFTDTLASGLESAGEAFEKLISRALDNVNKSINTLDTTAKTTASKNLAITDISSTTTAKTTASKNLAITDISSTTTNVDSTSMDIKSKMTEIDKSITDIQNQFLSMLGVVGQGIAQILSGDVAGGLLTILSQSDGFKNFMEELGPILADIANIVGAALYPALVMIKPPLKFLAEVFKFLATTTLTAGVVVLKGIRTILKGFEWLINGIIDLVNKLPFVDIGHVKLTGTVDALIDSLHDAMNNIANGTKEQTSELKKQTNILLQLKDAPTGLKLQSEIYAARTPIITTSNTNSEIHIYINGGDTEEIKRVVNEALAQNNLVANGAAII